MATEKQIKWRVRGRTLFEIKGIASKSNIANSRCLTPRERELLREAFDIITEDIVIPPCCGLMAEQTVEFFNNN